MSHKRLKATRSDNADEQTTTQDTSARNTLSQILSTTNPYPHATTPENYTWSTTTFRKIGFGQCGLVFTVPDQPAVVVKVARPQFGDSLRIDHLVHQKVVADFDQWNRDLLSSESSQTTTTDTATTHQITPIKLPQVFNFHEKPSSDQLNNQQWWDTHLPLFHPSQRSPPFPMPSQVLFTEHIPPLPVAAREALISLYCPPTRTPPGKTTSTPTA